MASSAGRYSAGKGKMSSKTVDHICEMEGAYVPGKVRSWMDECWLSCSGCGEADDWLIITEDDCLCNSCYWKHKSWEEADKAAEAQ